MTKSHNKIDISQMDNLSIDASQNPRSRRRMPRVNSKTSSKIVADTDEGDDNIGNKTNNHFGPRNNHEARPKPNGIHSHNEGRHNVSATSKKPKSKKKPSSNSKVNLEPLNPSTAAEHTNMTCRFILRPESSLTPYNINVDSPIPSHFSWRVVSPAKECPICSNVAEVPRMLGCGHIMCIHCMIQHRQYSESPNMCPICGETVNPNPIRAMPVSFMHADPAFLPKDGDEAISTLMSRPASSALALPVDVENPKGGRFKKFPAPDFVYWTRVTQCDLNYAKEELSRESKYLIGASKKSIQEYGSDEGYNDGITEIKRYLQMLNAQYARGPDVDTKNTSSPSTSTAATAPSSSSTLQNSRLSQPKQTKPKPEKPPQSDETVYFYQTAFESSTVYTLDTSDVSILKSAYGDYGSFPSSLVVKVENIQHTIYDRLRDKRLKYLSHLPEQTPVSFIECDWTGLLEPSVSEKFGPKLAERKRRKRQMQVQDSEDRRKAQASIERQFQLEVAEALLPHADIGGEGSAGIDTTQLPSLPSNSSAPPPPKVETKAWVDEEKEREEILKNAYVPKRGRKEMILRF